MTKNEEDFIIEITHTDREALKNIVEMVKREGMMVAEVGSWTGSSTLTLAGKIKDYKGVIFAIDHWQGSPKTSHLKWAEERDIYAKFKERMVKNNVWSVIKPMVMDSLTAARIFKDSSLDMVFIDADHRYKQVKQDVLAWLPKVRQGGIICGHDCEIQYKILTEWAKKAIDEVINSLDPDTFYIKPSISLHPGVVKSVYEIFNNNYGIMPGSSVWYSRVL